MVTAGDFKNGITIEYDGKICQIIEFQHVKPGKGAAFVRTKLKDIKITNDFHKSASDTQMSFLANPEESAILEEIKNADLSNMTPMKALLYLNELQERIR